MSKETFFLVWNPAAGANPRFRHGNLVEAEAEAARLATQNPGQEFYVLRAKSRSRRLEPVETVRLGGTR